MYWGSALQTIIANILQIIYNYFGFTCCVSIHLVCNFDLKFKVKYPLLKYYEFKDNIPMPAKGIHNHWTCFGVKSRIIFIARLLPTACNSHPADLTVSKRPGTSYGIKIHFAVFNHLYFLFFFMKLVETL